MDKIFNPQSALVPMVITKEGNMERSMDLYSRLMADRIISLNDQVNSVTAGIIINQLLFLEAEDPNKDIFFYINSPGGVITDGLAIYDTMQLIKPDVSTIVTGMAASMGSFLLAGGAAGKRYSLPNSTVLIHQPLGGAQGQCSDIQIQAKRIQYLKEKMAYLYEKHCCGKKTYDEIIAATDRDNSLTPEEALDFGLIDQIIENRGDMSVR